MEVVRCKSAVIETPTAQPVQLDGNEAEAVTRLEAHVEPGSLRLVHFPQPESGAPRKRFPVPLWLFPLAVLFLVWVARRTGRK